MRAGLTLKRHRDPVKCVDPLIKEERIILRNTFVHKILFPLRRDGDRHTKQRLPASTAFVFPERFGSIEEVFPADESVPSVFSGIKEQDLAFTVSAYELDEQSVIALPNRENFTAALADHIPFNKAFCVFVANRLQVILQMRRNRQFHIQTLLLCLHLSTLYRVFQRLARAETPSGQPEGVYINHSCEVPA